MPRLCVGIDFSGDHLMWSAGCGRSNVWIAEVECGSSSPTLRSVQRVQQLDGGGHPFDRLVRYLRGTDFAAAAIDSPFSVPAAYLPAGGHSELLKLVGEAKRYDDRPFLCAQEFVDLILDGRTLTAKKPLRRTEHYWQAKGVNVRSTLWAGARGGAAMTAACLRLLYTAGRPIWPWTQTGRGLLAEAFPAGQLRHWNLSYQRYAGDTDIDTRRSIVEAISHRIDLRNFRLTVEQCADALDAVICAFAAITVNAGNAFCYASEEITSEGLIAICPTVREGEDI
jgi:hypothetical protein